MLFYNSITFFPYHISRSTQSRQSTLAISSSIARSCESFKGKGFRWSTFSFSTSGVRCKTPYIQGLAPDTGKCSRNLFKLLRINGLEHRPFLYTFVPVKRERACFQLVVRKAIIRQSKDCYRSATLANCSRQKGIDIQRDRGDWFISPSFRWRYSEKGIQRLFRKNVSAIT